MRVHAGGIHAEGPDAPLVELGHLIAHGGELAVSPGGVVAGIEDQGHVRALEQRGRIVSRAVRARGVKGRRRRPDAQEVSHAVAPLPTWADAPRGGAPATRATRPAPAARPAARGSRPGPRPRASRTRRTRPGPASRRRASGGLRWPAYGADGGLPRRRGPAP